HEIVFPVGEAQGEFARRECRLVECELDDLLAHHVGNPVPDTIGVRRAVSESFGAAGAVKIVPPIKSRPGNAELFQGAAHRQRGLLDELDDLQLLGSRISHSASSPSPITLFLSNRFSSVSSATTSLRADASRRRSLTSSEVAARVVSPASRFLPASRK